MESTPWPRPRIEAALAAARAQDASFERGEILGSMCTAPHPIGAAAQAQFAETNLGDPGHFPGTAGLEYELLTDLSDLVHGSGPEACRFVTGGTEANLLACYLAREQSTSRRIIVPESAHFSFDKAARLLEMHVVRVPTKNHRADVAAMAAELHDAALVVGIAGTTELGLVDPIEALAAAALAAGVPCHVDAAFGGYILPFIDAAPFDLSVPGVTSIGLDPHKMGMAPIPGGALVLKDPGSWQLIAVQTDYVSTESQSTLMGTRPGSAVAATWATHRALGRDGYRFNAEQGLRIAREIATALESAGARLVAAPELNVVTFELGDPTETAKNLAAAGFRLNIVPRFNALRIVVNPHVGPDVAARFIHAFQELYA